jgi:hypothetical protein
MPLKWMLASSTSEFDEARCLGELRELPPPGEPGDWCDVLVHDDHGDQRWRVVVAETAQRPDPAQSEAVRSGSRAPSRF